MRSCDSSQRLLGALGLLLLLIVLPVSSHALTGDLDRDGDVDFDDFFMLTDNFGRTGQPIDECGREIATETQIRELSGAVPNLVGVFLLDIGGARGQTADWDSDLDEDGIRLSWQLRRIREDDRWDTSPTPEGTVVRVLIQFFWAESLVTEEKESEVPVFEVDTVTDADVTDVLVPFEAYLPLIPEDRRRPTVSFIVEIRVIQADGSVVADRTTASVPTGPRP